MSNQQANIGEQEITPQVAQQVAPDVVSPAGQQQLQAKQVAAQRMKGTIDTALGIAAKKLNGTSSTRVKDIDTATKKIVQKRLQGRDYGIKEVNDMLGGRLVVDKNKIGDAKHEIRVMSKQGLFKIHKEEDVKEGEYHGYHFDITTPDGERGEIQVHTFHSETESIANHDIRAQQGEDPDPKWEKVQKVQNQIIQTLPADKSRAVSQALQSLHKMNQNKPIPAVMTAKVIKQAQIAA